MSQHITFDQLNDADVKNIIPNPEKYPYQLFEIVYFLVTLVLCVVRSKDSTCQNLFIILIFTIAQLY